MGRKHRRRKKAERVTGAKKYIERSKVAGVDHLLSNKRSKPKKKPPITVVSTARSY